MSFHSNPIFGLALILALITFCKCMIRSGVESAYLTIDTDREALISFQLRVTSLKLPNPLSTWDHNNSSPCNWTGVVCSKYGRHTVNFDFINYQTPNFRKSKIY